MSNPFQIKGITWYYDQIDDQGFCSMQVLLSWLAAPGNYQRWCHAPSKLPLCAEVLIDMQDETIYHQNETEIEAVVEYLEESFRIAKQYYMRIMPTLVATNPSDGWRIAQGAKKVIKRCEHWIILNEIMGGLPTTHPIIYL
ncbi:uncharacterized protein PGTG_00271 [Puccinia graminis f. sp. tritici CRL 75-36-700-3]|uniref:Uncharacterized protein n=1 Tax=Puccinia graminis f. sp. tritici (strain CRL 75-36-700-3 / race SCCL) TaxID=418459 RepID=E3JQU3_PUCGT|nr:uncharacterized protein PGTG_00271 [Puccinia graminis f. sp. tritici CRL 75-36-700-3]EFP74315.1 hypothetical protein PGTG_00271 [Puccinia graminis f. sp. tritici CRL 75-36-700-3]